MGPSSLLHGEVVLRVGWALVHSVWQAALLAGALWLLLAALRGRSSGARYVAACGALALMLGLPLATVAGLRIPSGTRPPVGAQDAGMAGVEAGTPSPAQTPSQLAASRSESRPSAASPAAALVPTGRPRADWLAFLVLLIDPVLPWAVSAWFLGASVFAMRLCGSWATVRVLGSLGIRPVATERVRAVARAAERLKLPQPIRVLESSLARVPTVLGWLRPTMLIPASALVGLSPAQFEAIVLHELAHIRRHGYLINMLQSVAEVLMFYHPAVWWVSRQIRLEREHCCDDVAVAACEDRRLYARALADLQGLALGDLQGVLAATDGPLLRRVQRLVSPGASTPPARWPAGLGVLTALAALFVVALAPRPAQSQAPKGDVGERRVGLVAEEAVPREYAEAVREVVAVAGAALAEWLPEAAPSPVRVVVNRAPGHFEHTTTDRHDTIHVTVGDKGLGERFHPIGDPVVILCLSFAELYNPWRLPGLEEYVTARYLGPAIVDKLGTQPLPNSHLAEERDDPTGLLVAMQDPLYASAHPDLAAASALLAIEDRLGPDGLRKLIYALPEAADDPLPLLRDSAVAADPALAEVFAWYEAATLLEVDEGGSCLVTSFEEDETLSLQGRKRFSTVGEVSITHSGQLDVGRSHDWATDGDSSLRVSSKELRNYMTVWLSDPDWRFKDWTRFARFQMDVLLDADEPQQIAVWADDDVWEGHGRIPILPPTNLEPGRELNVSLDLTPETLAGGPAWKVPYFDGQVRAREISEVCLQVPKPTGPFALYLDNVRLTPRTENEAPPPPPNPPAAKERTDEAERQAATHVQAGTAAKRAGNLQEAEKQLRQALNLDPGNVEARRVLAWTLAELGRKPEAAAEFRKVIELSQDQKVRQEAEAALRRLE
jgi:beta-lactamase regulating signal transducer with metallopeptidase domain